MPIIQRMLLANCVVIMSCIICGPHWVHAKNDATLAPQSKQDEAERSFFSGLAHYRAGKFEQAIIGFQRAHAAVPNRALLYNVARCHERLGTRQAAIAWYRAYLETQPADTTAVAAKIQRLAPVQGNGAMGTDGAANTAITVSKPIELQSIGYRWTKWGLVGMAGASLSVSLG